MIFIRGLVSVFSLRRTSRSSNSRHRGGVEPLSERHIGFQFSIHITMKFFGSTLVVLTIASAVGAFVFQPSTVKTSQSTLAKTQTRHHSSALKAANDEGIGFATSSSKDLELLGLPARPGRPLKVAIAGGGVGGLTAALCMLKKGFDVTVYEKTSAFARFGGPIQFASNALSVLKEIDEQLFDRIMDKFTFTGIRTCGIKDGTKPSTAKLCPLAFLCTNVRHFCQF